jgi:CheY-like chemotaxis protein
LLATILESHGAIVKSVASVAEALDAISRRKPNILLADLQMPDEDGYALVEKLRSREREAQLGRLPVIAVTACVAKEDRQRTRACGFDGHVAKPFEAEEIVRVVAEFGVKAMARHSN